MARPICSGDILCNDDTGDIYLARRLKNGDLEIAELRCCEEHKPWPDGLKLVRYESADEVTNER